MGPSERDAQFSKSIERIRRKLLWRGFSPALVRQHLQELIEHYEDAREAVEAGEEGAQVTIPDPGAYVDDFCDAAGEKPPLGKWSWLASANTPILTAILFLFLFFVYIKIDYAAWTNHMDVPSWFWPLMFWTFFAMYILFPAIALAGVWTLRSTGGGPKLAWAILAMTLLISPVCFQLHFTPDEPGFTGGITYVSYNPFVRAQWPGYIKHAFLTPYAIWHWLPLVIFMVFYAYQIWHIWFDRWSGAGRSVSSDSRQ